MARLATLIATWFGAGNTPKGPGTAGSLAALLCVAPWPNHIAWIAALPVLETWLISNWVFASVVKVRRP